VTRCLNPLFGGKRKYLLPLFFLLLTAGNAFAQTTEQGARYQIKVGASYDRGDYGTTEVTRVLFVPVTIRYFSEKYDFSVTPSFSRSDSTGGLRIIEGVPTPTGETTTTRQLRSAPGDTVLRARYYLQRGTESIPSVTPFAKFKIPTADQDMGLGTGKADFGFGVEVDHQVSNILVFGDLAYTVIGKIPGVGMRNRIGASFGIGERLTNSLVLSGMIDWRQSIVPTNPDPTELVGVLTYRARPGVTLSPNIYVGLTDSSSDYGAGIELAVRFGRR
jgi:hypothetical protein